MIKRLISVSKFILNNVKQTIQYAPDIISTSEAIDALKTETIKSYYDVSDFINKIKVSDGSVTKYNNVYYFGKEHQTDEDYIFKEAERIVEKVFGDVNHPILATYENYGFKFQYVYHTGLNGTGDFIDYMKDATKKLEMLNNEGTSLRTIMDMFNDYIDDVTDWLYVFRI